MALLRSKPALVKSSQSQWIVTPDEQGSRLDRYLAAADRLGSRSRVVTALERGKVFVNDVEVTGREAARRVAPGDVVRVWMDRPGSQRRRGPFESRGLEILYEDEALLVVNKRAGLLSVPLARGSSSARGAESASPSVFGLLAEHLGPHGRRHPFVVHRIDRDTSGIVVFAKTAAAQRAIKDQFARREPERIYWAVVHGRPRPDRGRWRDHLVWDEATLKQVAASTKHPKAVEAVSDYRVLEAFSDASLIEVRLHTGKRNQIRIQAALRGHPLLGERQYATSALPFPRQALHAHRLGFAHPIDGRPLTFDAPLPTDMAEMLHRMRKLSDQR